MQNQTGLRKVSVIRQWCWYVIMIYLSMFYCLKVAESVINDKSLLTLILINLINKLRSKHAFHHDFLPKLTSQHPQRTQSLSLHWRISKIYWKILTISQRKITIMQKVYIIWILSLRRKMQIRTWKTWITKRQQSQ